ncbi:MAG: hypothetical protein ACRDPO_31535 [Streptosporangiaceae bacterium]
MLAIAAVASSSLVTKTRTSHGRPAFYARQQPFRRQQAPVGITHSNLGRMPGSHETISTQTLNVKQRQ